MKTIEYKLKLEKALKNKESKSKVYELYNKYHSSYTKEKGHSDKERGDYIELYFKFLDYMNTK